MGCANSILSILLVLGALSIDPATCLRRDDVQYPVATTLSPDSISQPPTVAELPAWFGPALIHGLPPDEKILPPTTRNNDNDNNNDNTNADTTTNDDPYDPDMPDPFSPSPGGEPSAPDTVVVFVNLIGWSLAAVGVLCLFYFLLRYSRRASSWAWGPSRTFPQPLFLAEPTPASQLLQPMPPPSSSTTTTTTQQQFQQPLEMDHQQPTGFRLYTSRMLGVAGPAPSHHNHTLYSVNV